MFTIRIWCDHKERYQQMRKIISSFEIFRVLDVDKRCDVLLVDIADTTHTPNQILPILQKLNGKTIYIFFADDSAKLLDIMGLYVYQYILHDQIEQRLPSCLESISSFLMNISTICVHQHGEKMYIKIKEIYDIQYEEGIVYIDLEHERYATQYTSLEKIKKQLDDSFLFANRNTIVQVGFITAIDAVSITLSNQKKVTLSRRRKKQISDECVRRWKK